MNSKKKCVDYEKIMTRKVEKEEMEILRKEVNL